MALALLGLAAPAVAAPLALEHSATQVTEAGSGDGVISPGETVDIVETLLSSEPSPVSGLTGTLTAGSGASIVQGSSPFPDVAFGATTANSTPFRATIASSLQCGQNASFSLTVATGADSATVPFTVGTGALGPSRALDSGDVPHVIPNPGVLVSSLAVTDSGRVKEVRVRLGRITHPYVGDLQISLISPAGTKVLLVDRRGGPGDDFVDTVIAPTGASLGAASAPFSGTFAAEGDLGRFVGEPLEGTWKLEVVDTSPADSGVLNAWGTDVRGATCAALPVAVLKATPNPAAVGQTVTFDASQSTDPVGTITRHEWDLDGDGSYETDTGATPTATSSYPTRASVPVGLRITDDGGLSDTDEITLSVTVPPSAALSATPASPLTGETTTLDASGSTDSDGTVAGYDWDLDGDGTFEVDGGTTPTRPASFATAGDHVVRVRVTDDNGATDVEALTITARNRDPVARFAFPSPAVVGSPATFSAAASTDADGTIGRYEWDLDGDGSFETDTATAASATTTFAAPGTVNVSLRVTDDGSGTHVVTHAVTVTRAPMPVLSAPANPARPNRSVTFSAAGSDDPDGTIVRHEWDLDGNGTYETDTGTVTTASRTFSAPVSFTARLRVTDDAGATASATLPFSVVNALPVVAIGASPDPAQTGQDVVLDASATTDPDGAPVRYEWDLDGNGSFELDTGATPATTRRFPNPGVLTIRVRVTDNDGGVAVGQRALTVVRPAAGGGSTPGGGSGGTPGGPAAVPPATPGGAAPPAAAPPGDQGPAPAPPGVADPPAGRPFSAGLLGAPLQSLARARRSGITVLCRADRAVLCSVTVEISARDARRLQIGRNARKPVIVGRAVVALLDGGDQSVRVKLSARLRKALRRQRRVLLLVRATAGDRNGHLLRLSRAVLLRR